MIRTPPDRDSPYPLPPPQPREAILESLADMHERWCLLFRRMVEQMHKDAR